MLSAVAGTVTIPVIYPVAARLVGPLAVFWRRDSRSFTLHVRFSAESVCTCGAHLRGGDDLPAYLLSESPAVTLSGSVNDPPDDKPPAKVLFSRRRDSSLSFLRVGTLGAQSIRITRGTGPSDGLAWTGYVLFTAAAMLTHSTALLLLLAANLFVFGLMWRCRKTFPAPKSSGENALHPPMLRLWAAQAGVLLLWGAIWLPAFIHQAGGVYREFWLPAPTWLAVVDTLGNFLSAHLPRQQMPWLDLIWVVYASLLALGIVGLRTQPAVRALLLTLFLTPLVAALLISLWRPVFYDRTLIWATIPLYVLLAAGIAMLRRWPWFCRVGAAGAQMACLARVLCQLPKEGWKEATTYVSQNLSEGA
jgi:hypothetical protein